MDRGCNKRGKVKSRREERPNPLLGGVPRSGGVGSSCILAEPYDTETKNIPSSDPQAKLTWEKKEIRV